MQQAQQQALATVAEQLERAGVGFLLGGSGLLHALGLDVVVGDLDLMVAGDDLARVEDALGGWVAGVVVGDAPDPWCSDWIARLDLGDVDGDLIGGLCVRVGGRRVPIPMRGTRVWDVAGTPVPLADPAVWWWIYRAYKPEKAALLEASAVVTSADREAVARELGAPPAPPESLRRHR